jgi:hypothetical protein
MATVEESLYTYLNTVSGITSLVGTRIYPFRIAQGSTMPCLTYQRISTPRIITHDVSGKTGTLASPRFQFDAWGVTYAQVKSITEALRDALNGKSSTGFQVALIEDESPEYAPDEELWRSRSDYRIWHEE